MLIDPVFNNLLSVEGVTKETLSSRFGRNEYNGVLEYFSPKDTKYKGVFETCHYYFIDELDERYHYPSGDSRGVSINGAALSIEDILENIPDLYLPDNFCSVLVAKIYPSKLTDVCSWRWMDWGRNYNITGFPDYSYCKEYASAIDVAYAFEAFNVLPNKVKSHGNILLK